MMLGFAAGLSAAEALAAHKAVRTQVTARTCFIDLPLFSAAAERRKNVAPGASPGTVPNKQAEAPEGRKKFFRPAGADPCALTYTHGLRRGLHSCAAPRLRLRLGRWRLRGRRLNWRRRGVSVPSPPGRGCGAVRGGRGPAAGLVGARPQRG